MLFRSIGEGTWGAPLRSVYSPNSWTRDEGSFDAFQVVFVSKYKTEVKTVKFDIVAGVEELTDDDSKWSLPPSISLWTPANGSTVVLTNPDVSGIEKLHKVPLKSSVYPNPASNTLNIKFDRSERKEKATVSIFNGMAKLIHSTELNDLSGISKIDVSDLANGTYYIYIKYSDHNECHKVIITH